MYIYNTSIYANIHSEYKSFQHNLQQKLKPPPSFWIRPLLRHQPPVQPLVVGVVPLRGPGQSNRFFFSAPHIVLQCTIEILPFGSKESVSICYCTVLYVCINIYIYSIIRYPPSPISICLLSFSQRPLCRLRVCNLTYDPQIQRLCGCLYDVYGLDFQRV